MTPDDDFLRIEGWHAGSEDALEGKSRRPLRIGDDLNWREGYDQGYDEYSENT